MNKYGLQMKRLVGSLCLTCCFLAGGTPYIYAQAEAAAPEKGVTLALAEQRVKQIHGVEYDLAFQISASSDSLSRGRVTVTFRLDQPQEVVLDFYNAAHVEQVSLPCQLVNEHIVLPASSTKAGENRVTIDFRVEPRLLNYRGELVYTLSVPDKARRLFPCFDQPDMKSIYRLTLTLPAGWKAISNGKSLAAEDGETSTTIRFAPTEPLSTYLFAFAAGKFSQRSMTQKGRTITLYHCETDPARVAQCDDILKEVFASLDWLEEYTAIPYPFAKYELALIPGFQFGGMEHTGATLYNDQMLFLLPQATLNERLARTALIAHETAHMWFGDYVTMRWFGEVWTKEVFANYYAACMSEPLYPDVDHRLRFMLSYAPTAYAEDRTEGANPIQQLLPNLQDAGLIYGNIIYDKSPMMMRQLVAKIGSTTFREGIRSYLKRYAFGNATWEDLIEILDDLSPEDLKAWSHSWVNEAGMPVYRISRKGQKLVIRQPEVVRPQKITFLIDGEMMVADCSSAVTTLRIPAGAKTILPNVDGMAYGYFAMEGGLQQASIDAVRPDSTKTQSRFKVDALVRGALLINLHEAMWRGDLSASDFSQLLTTYLPAESDPQLYSLAAGYLRVAHNRYAEGANEPLEEMLTQLLLNDSVPSRKVVALRALADVMESPKAIDTLYGLWSGATVVPNFTLSDVDAMNLSYQLAIRLPEKADEIVKTQHDRLTNDYFRRQYEFVSPAVSPRQEERDALFERLLQPEGRSVEPWALSALSFLNHRYRRSEGLRYVERGLEALEEVKRTGDIFIPKSWVSMLLYGHCPDEAAAKVKEFLAAHPDYPSMLRNKILMNIYQPEGSKK
jgi:aminopeptidase N